MAETLINSEFSPLLLRGIFLEKQLTSCYNQTKSNDFYCGGVFAAASKRSMYSAIPEILLFKTRQTTKQQEMRDGGSGQDNFKIDLKTAHEGLGTAVEEYQREKERIKNWSTVNT